MDFMSGIDVIWRDVHPSRDKRPVARLVLSEICVLKQPEHMGRTIKAIARRLIGKPLLGSLDYYVHPQMRQAWGGPFNGQRSRTALFNALMKVLSPAAIVETGTHLGTTTEFFARANGPVYSVELDARAYGFARTRLRKRRNVFLLRGDSREALRRWFDGPLGSLAGRTIFFYLDAHGNPDLPLAEELDIIYARCQAAAVMVDDFKVPDDVGYSYDDYGPGNALTPEYIELAVKTYGLVAFYPATRGVEETGERCGCVVLVRKFVYGDALASLDLLRSAPSETKQDES